MIELYNWVTLIEDLPKFGLKAGDRAIVIEHYRMPEGQEDGYSLEGFDIEIPGITVEVRASQIVSTQAPKPDRPIEAICIEPQSV